MDIFKTCPVLENEKFLLRAVQDSDCDDLLAVYSDKGALPFFNSDNCHGDNFYYETGARMKEALDFWDWSYKNGWFVRLSIVDKEAAKVIGTVELCRRVSEDAFNNIGVLRVDVGSSYEREAVLYEIMSLTAPSIPEMLGCRGVITKVPVYAVERLRAVQKAGFVKSPHLLIGEAGHTYDGYWVKE